MTDAPIFIVGQMRSGTTLLASMINEHPRIACGPESALFTMLSPKDADAITEDAAWPDRALDFLRSWSHRRTGSVVESFGVPWADVEAIVQAGTPSVATTP